MGSIQGEEKAWRTKNNRTIKKDAALTETVYGGVKLAVENMRVLISAWGGDDPSSPTFLGF